MKNICQILVLSYVLGIPFSAIADTCRDTYQRVKFYTVMIWQGDDINPPIVKCIYNDDIPRRRDPHVSYTLPGKFVPVSGGWQTHDGQSQCYYRSGPCVFNKVG